MQVELVFDIIFIVHQISRLPAYSWSPSRHRIYPNFQTTFHMRRGSSFKPWFISVECITALTEEMKNIICPRTPVWFKNKQPCIVIMKASVLYSADVDVWRINFSFAHLLNHYYYYHSLSFPLSFSLPPL